MRVIAGSKRGKKLAVFPGDAVRPTSDRVRENIFNIISPYISDAVVLDLFAGTGAFSVEALSRGAKECILCDMSPSSIQLVRKNLDMTDLIAQANVITTEALQYLANTEGQFDIIFLDPPYNTDLLAKALGRIAARPILRDGGIVVCEHDATDEPGEHDRLELKKSRKYGRTIIDIYAMKQLD